MNTAVHIEVHLHQTTRCMDDLAHAVDALVKVSLDDAAAALAENLYVASRRLYRDYVRATSEREFARTCVGNATAGLEQAYAASRERVRSVGAADWRTMLAWSAVSRAYALLRERLGS